MTDFVGFRPDEHGDPLDDMLIRRAAVDDVDDLATVMASRGGTVSDHAGSAARLIATAPVVLLSQRTHEEASIIGWSGAVRIPLRPGGAPEWMIAGLTVLPSWRRRGIGATLLRDVVAAISLQDPGSVVHSIVNARNKASLSLHARTGFEEAARGESFAGVAFDGGVGVLLSRIARWGNRRGDVPGRPMEARP